MKLRRQNSKTSRLNLRSRRPEIEPVRPESKSGHEFIPRYSKDQAEFGGDLDSRGILARLNHLNITPTDVGQFGKFLLGHSSGISQAIHILTEAAIFELAHSLSFMKNTKITAKHTSPFYLPF